MKIEVYFNLHKKLFSIRALSGENKGRVIAHRDRVAITGADFVVQKAGREKVLAEGRKNVHAFIRGQQFDEINQTQFGGIEWTMAEVRQFPELFGEVKYNPYRAGCFQHFDGDDARRIDHAGFVFCFLDENGKPQIIFLKREGASGPSFCYGEFPEFTNTSEVA